MNCLVFLFCFFIFIIAINPAYGSPIFERTIFDDALDDSLTLNANENLDQMDIVSITYSSDGTKLNSTVWFKDPISINSNFIDLTFAIIIDSDVNTESGFNGVDFGDSYFFEDNSWKEKVVEFPNELGYREISVIDDLNSPILDGTHEQAISFSTDLIELGNPDNFLIAFMAFNKTSTTVDITNWIEIPPPNYEIIISPDNITLEPGEEDNIEILVKSNSHVSRTAEMSVELNGLQVNYDSSELNFNAHGRDSVTLHVKAPTGEYRSQYTNIVTVVSKLPEGVDVTGNQNIEILDSKDDFLPKREVADEEIKTEATFMVHVKSVEFYESSFFENVIKPITFPIFTGAAGVTITLFINHRFKKNKETM